MDKGTPWSQSVSFDSRRPVVRALGGTLRGVPAAVETATTVLPKASFARWGVISTCVPPPVSVIDGVPSDHWTDQFGTVERGVVILPAVHL
ncbi:hypothetical protein LC1Hm_0729 [Halomicrobium sp. LC1Hm]|nr:hypothetical protein LC1Hm_0729 [Halomicrobium sp. LC1Hm]